MADQIIHAFEKAGLGLAPFQYVRSYESKYVACQGAPVQPGTCCDYCGTGIMYVFVIRSSDGKQFKVGCECVNKTDDRGLINVTKKAMNKLKADARHAREAEKIAAARKLLADSEIRAKLATEKHPRAMEMGNPFFDDKSLLDWADWMMKNAGNSGRMQVSRTIERFA